MIFLLMTAAAGNARLTFRIRVPMRFQARLNASETASKLLMFPSLTASDGSSSIAYRSTM
jgi:hypothetical protein